jgi:hypothetical protein
MSEVLEERIDLAGVGDVRAFVGDGGLLEIELVRGGGGEPEIMKPGEFRKILKELLAEPELEAALKAFKVLKKPLEKALRKRRPSKKRVPEKRIFRENSCTEVKRGWAPGPIPKAWRISPADLNREVNTDSENSFKGVILAEIEDFGDFEPGEAVLIPVKVKGRERSERNKVGELSVYKEANRARTSENWNYCLSVKQLRERREFLALQREAFMSEALKRETAEKVDHIRGGGKILMYGESVEKL